jgi:hypothetical protein
MKDISCYFQVSWFEFCLISFLSVILLFMDVYEICSIEEFV